LLEIVQEGFHGMKSPYVEYTNGCERELSMLLLLRCTD